jgi:ornithine carbamoyltransferase
MSPPEEAAVVERARRLKRAALAGSTKALLRGKKLGLLSEADDEDVASFRSAAAELGAHVSHIRPSLSDLSTAEEVRRTSQLLGRLYDAVECQGIAGALVGELRKDAGIPIYNGVTGARHPTARLAEQLGTDTSTQANRRFILQAVLLSTIA